MITLELRPDLPVLALVSCVSRKLDGPVPARELYTSGWFRKARALVEARRWPWRVLSAKHGLLRPEEPVERYNLTLKKMPRADQQAWATRVLAQLDEELGEPHQLLVFAGDRYVEFLLPPLADSGHLVVRPLEGLGIGQQLRALLDLHAATAAKEAATQSAPRDVRGALRRARRGYSGDHAR